MATPIFFTAEMLETETGLELVSIALSTKDAEGKDEYWAIHSDFIPSHASLKEQDEILTFLPEHYIADTSDSIEQQQAMRKWKSAKDIASDINAYMAERLQGEVAQLIGYQCSFDYFVFTRLFGKRDDQPLWMPTYPLDLAQYEWNADSHGETPRLEERGSIGKVRWLREYYKFLCHQAVIQ